MRFLLLTLSILIFFSEGYSQSYHAEDVKIARDSFGIPHIMAPTDEGVAFGLAWAQCEDQFITMQELMAACRGVLGEIKGKDGVVADIGIQYMGLSQFVNKNYESDVSDDFKSYLSAFVDGVNLYAEKHPGEILLKKLFPVTERDILVGYLLGNVEISGAGSDLSKILNGKIIQDLEPEFQKGSNAFAISKSKTKDANTYIAINSHQPMEGWYSWYEAHLISEEGLNILGGTFAGGVCIFHGVNENLAWAHTVNHADFSDVYRLTVSKDEKSYLMDNEWLPLKKRKIKAKLKMLGFLKIPVSRVVYETAHGPAFKTDKGFYAWSFSAGKTLKMAEQWFQMNKSINLLEFKSALEIRGIVSLNIVYADNEDNLFYISNGRIPKRNPEYNWKKVLPGHISELVWTDDLIPLDTLPQVLNPSSGYIYNTNNTPFSSTDKLNNPKESLANYVMGYQSVGVENNRSHRFEELIKNVDEVDYDLFSSIKYDHTYPSYLTMPNGKNLEDLLHIDPEKYPNVSDAIKLLNEWDRKTGLENDTAPLFILTVNKLNSVRRKYGPLKNGDEIKESHMVEAIVMAKDELIEKFGNIKIPLKKFQFHTRGNISIPMRGGPDVLSAIYAVPQKDGTYKAVSGESYILMVKFGPEGVGIESINAYGASEKENSSHFTDQMEYFANQKLKKMTLNKDEVLRKAVRIYSPGM